MSKLTENKRAGLYMRLSQEDERAGESQSIENQKTILEKYALDNGFEVVDEYIDDGWSGTTFERPEVQRLLEDAKNGRINTIIVKDLSRFGRSYIEVGQYTDYIFPTYNIRFIAIGDGVDSAVSNGSGMDMTPIMNVFNEWHAASTSKKIREVIEANARDGRYRTTYAPYGYIKGDDEKHLPIVDEEAAVVVKRIFEMRASGISPQKIAEALNNDHVMIPSDYKEKKYGIPNTRRSHHLWSCGTVTQMLHNPIYLGNLVQMRTTTVSYKNHTIVRRDPEDMIVVEHTHEAIISQELWDRCREVEASVSQGKKNKKGIVLPLSGLCYCADCGAKMHSGWNNTRKSRNSPRIYYREHMKCGAYAKFGTIACSSHYINLKILNEIVLTDIRSKMHMVFIDEKKAREEFLSYCREHSDKELAADRKKLRAAQKRLTELDRLISSVYEDKVLGKVDESVCIELLGRYQKEREQRRSEVADIEAKLKSSDKAEQNVDEFIRRLRYYMNVPELTREMCLQLIEFITVDECPGKYSKAPREIHIYYKLINSKESAEWLDHAKRQDYEYFSDDGADVPPVEEYLFSSVEAQQTCDDI